MSARYGIPAAIFAIKVTFAALLALYLSLRIGLERPYWAVMTSLIIAQPLAGAVLSKAVFRVAGTVLGAAACVLMVPALSSAPELLVVAIALWLGLCIFVSLLDRTPRSYVFLLAGYSACLIALPSVEDPASIFDVAVLRVQEIVIGIACASFAHGLILPTSVSAALMGKVDASLRDARRWSRDSLSEEPVPELDAERRRLALDITEMHQMAVHLPFDTARAAPRQKTVRALQAQLSLILPLAAAVDDRIRALSAEDIEPTQDIRALLADSRAWLDEPGSDAQARHASAEALIARAAALEPEVRADTAWRDALRLSLLARLGALIAAHRDCCDLRDQMGSATAQPLSPRIERLLAATPSRTLHRDYRGAARSALGAALTVTIGCALWIGSGWDEGATAVMLSGVFLSLFATADDPIAPIRFFLIGTVIAAMIGAFYAFVVLPELSGFAMLAAALAPAFLIGGALMTNPRYGIVALASMLGLGSPFLLSARYTADFAAYANGMLPQFVAAFFALTMVRLLNSAGLDGAIHRTLRAGWNDIARRSMLDKAPDVLAWISRMLDRIGLLAPRLAARGSDPGQPLYDALRDLRTGIVIGELRQLRIDLPDAQGRAITPVLSDIGDYYARMDPVEGAAPRDGMLRRIDEAMTTLASTAPAVERRQGMLALISLRRNVFPSSPGYVPSLTQVAA